MRGQRRLALVMKGPPYRKATSRGAKYSGSPGRQEVNRSLAAILNLQPERLDAALVEVDAEDGAGFVPLGTAAETRMPSSVLVTARARRAVVEWRRPLEGEAQPPSAGAERGRWQPSTAGGRCPQLRSSAFLLLDDRPLLGVCLMLGTGSQSRISSSLGSMVSARRTSPPASHRYSKGRPSGSAALGLAGRPYPSDVAKPVQRL